MATNIELLRFKILAGISILPQVFDYKVIRQQSNSLHLSLSGVDQEVCKELGAFPNTQQMGRPAIAAPKRLMLSKNVSS